MPEKYAVLINVLFKTPVVILLPMIAACIVMAIFFFKRSQREAAIELHVKQDGIAITAHIVKHRVLQRDYYVTYSYEYEGKMYEKEQKISSDLFNSLRDGDTIEVSHLPEDPNVSLLVRAEGIYLKSAQTKLAASFFCITSILLLSIEATVIVRWMIWMVHNG